MIDSDVLDKALVAIQKKYPNSVGIDHDRNPHRISTGSYELDRATGGGIPLDRFTHIWGDWSSGKSLTCWNIARNAQAMGMTVVYYNVEKQYHPAFVEAHGVDTAPDKFIVVEGQIIEEIGAKLEVLLGGAELHIIDSLSAAISIDELNTPAENNPAMALSARAWSRVLRKAEARSGPHNAVIMVNQSRDRIGYGGGDHAPGGKFIDFVSSLTIRFRKGKWLFYDKEGFLTDDGTNTATLSGMTEADGLEIQATVMKSRVCRPLRTAKMYLDFKTMEFDPMSDLEKAARFYKVVEGSGAWYTLPSKEKVQGRKNLRKAIDEDKELQELIITKLVEDQ